jgi:hypothetical protein
MEIKKIDRKRIQEKKEEEARIAKAKARLAKQKIAEKKLKREKISKKKLALYIAALVVLLVTSLAYNFFTISQAKQPIHTGSDTTTYTLEMEFYELCDDIENVKLEQGVYPKSIKDLEFSDYLSYSLLPDDAFFLSYDDGQISLSYDSSKDFGEIE